MKINCIWEHNGNDSLLYAADFAGAFTRGESRQTAAGKMPGEVTAYLRWRGMPVPEKLEVEFTQEKDSNLEIRDADSDVLFAEEREPLPREEYEQLKSLVLKSAADFQALYDAIPDKHTSILPERRTFYGNVPRTAQEMYDHTKNVNAYYFGEIGVDADNNGTIQDCRQRGFAKLEQQANFLDNAVIDGSYGEQWSVRKVLRRFLWHDRIHAKAMYRMAVKTFGSEIVPNVFSFDL